MYTRTQLAMNSSVPNNEIARTLLYEGKPPNEYEKYQTTESGK